MNQAENPYQSSAINENPFSSGGDSGNVETVRILQATRPWVFTISILLFLFGGLLVLGGIGFGFYGVVGNPQGFTMLIGAAMYLLLGVLMYIIPATILFRYAKRISAYAESTTNENLNRALDAQRGFWKYLVLVVLSLFVLYVLVVVLGVGLFSMSRM